MTHYLERHKPRLLVPPGREVAKPGNPHPGQPRNELVRLMGLLWTTWDQQHPTDLTALDSSYTTRGYNWSLWEDALTTRILARGGTPADEIQVLGNQVQLKGEAVLDLASMMDVAFFGHWIPPNMVQEVKQRSTAPDGTRVYFWTDLESIGHALPWNYQRNEVWDALHQISPHPNPPDSYIGDAVLLPYGATVNPVTHYITGGANGWGLPHIDKYESQPAPVACPHVPSHGQPPYVNPPSLHSWDLDIYQLTGGGVANSAQATRCVNVYLGLLESYGYDVGGTYVADGFCFDNLLEAPYKGTATNAYPDGWADRYRAGWVAFLETWQTVAQTSKLPDPWRCVWGNGPPGTRDPYSSEQARQRYVEHAFRTGGVASTWEELQARFQLMASSGQYSVLAFNGTQASQWYWGTTAGGPVPAVNGTWSMVVEELKRLGLLDRTYVAAWQMLGQNSWAFWQEGFREPS